MVPTLAAALLLLLAGACGDDDGPTGLDPSQFELVRISGGGQTGLAGTVLFEPLTVQLRSRDGGAPEEGEFVTWSVIQGGGSATRSSSATDTDGLASTRVQLGQNGGVVRLEARVTGLPEVVFNLTALPPPVLESVSPSSVDPGDTVDVQVADLPAGLGVEVVFDGESGEVVSISGGDPAILRVVVPPPAGVCDAAVDDVDVRVRVGGVTTAPVAIDVNVPADPFGVGQVLVIEGTADVQCALLPADGGTARYLLAALSAELESAGDVQVTLGGSSVTLASADLQRSPPPVDFHDRLRRLDRQIAAQRLPEARPAGGAQTFAQPDIGSERTFLALNDPDFADANDLTAADFDQVTATLRFKGAHTLLYVDNRAPSGGLTQSDIDFLGELYDRRLFDADVDFFGEPTDVDGNSRIVILLTPTVNAMSPAGSEGIVIGFFFGLDLIDAGTPNCSFCDFSNEAEILYGFVPDPDGIFGGDLSRDRVRDLLPGVMVHEMQHMISFRFKIFENAVGPEALWLSEGLAHMAEELGGDETDLAGQTATADELYASNFARAARYLIGPDSISLTAYDASSLGGRGAAWLFMRWIADQYGDFIFRDLTQAPETGFANVEAQTGEPFFRLFADWAVALWADDRGISGLDLRYEVPKWLLRDIIRVEPAQGEPTVYALQPLQRTFTEFRSGSINEFLAGNSPLYVELDADGDMQDLQLELNAGASAGLAILRFE